MEIRHPYLLFLGDAPDSLAAKTASGVAFWRPDWCVGQLRLAGCRADLGLPDRSLTEAAALGARTLLIGVANRGGTFAPSWEPMLLAALDAGFDLASGLHARLSELPTVRERAAALGRRLVDVRRPDGDYAVGTGIRRPGKRLLTVGTDCSVGKMFTALAIEREMRRRGLDAEFRATGQTGILIAGGGVPLDAVVADFIAGAVEALAPANRPGHWDLVEGQATVLHPSYAGVTLGLIHGSQPDALVLCHEPGRPHMRGLPHRPMPGLAASRAAHEAAARLTNPQARTIGLALNTAALDPDAARDLMARLAEEHGLPCVDPLRTGVAALVDVLEAL